MHDDAADPGQRAGRTGHLQRRVQSVAFKRAALIIDCHDVVAQIPQRAALEDDRADSFQILVYQLWMVEQGQHDHRFAARQIVRMTADERVIAEA